jgi:GPH family glycoside/pentoside/hexuronide:cation symporter
MNSSTTTATKLKPSRYIGYGLGDFAFNFYWLPLKVFLLKYYTDVLGLSSSTAGYIIMICLIWDALIDPAIGIVSNKTRTRFGSYRPYMLFGCVPLAASFALMFFPVPFKETSLIIYAFTMQLVFRTCYAAVNIPYGAMMASMTRDSMERNWLAGARMVCAFGGATAVGYYTPRLVEYFQSTNPGSAHFFAAATFSGIAIVVILLSFMLTEERIATGNEPSPPVMQLLKMIVANKPFQLTMAGIALFSFGDVVVNSSLAYFVQYYMGQDPKITGNATSIISVTQLIAILPWTIASRYLGKRWAWIVGLAIAAGALLFLFFTDQPSMRTFYGVLIVYAVGSASIAVNFWSMVPDTVEYGQWKSGVRGEGFIFGFVTLIQKIAFAVSAGFVGQYLVWIGYVANQAQSAATLSGLKLLITLIAVAGLVTSSAVIYFYRLDSKEHARIVGEIARA